MVANSSKRFITRIVEIGHKVTERVGIGSYLTGTAWYNLDSQDA